MRDETKRDDGWWVICLVVADDEGLFSVNNHPGYRSDPLTTDVSTAQVMMTKKMKNLMNCF
jgi:hypothetical protein